VHDEAGMLIDGQPVTVALQNAAALQWSGILRAMLDLEQVGVVVMRDGHIAWAVSNSQRENFASFLERIGMVPKEKLDAVVDKYRSLGKSKKLGALLEEAGLISHGTLRECLKAHVRAALASLQENPRITLEAKDGEMAVDASLIFLLGEVTSEADVPSAASDEPPEPAVQELCPGVEDRPLAMQALLAGLEVLPGYLYSFVADSGGAVVALHAADGVAINADHCVPAVNAWLGTALQSSGTVGMGAVQFAFVQSAHGSLFAHMTDTDHRQFIVVACNEQAKLGVVKHKISELIPAVRTHMRDA
jgi:hypothetical protein